MSVDVSDVKAGSWCQETESSRTTILRAEEEFGWKCRSYPEGGSKLKVRGSNIKDVSLLC